MNPPRKCNERQEDIVALVMGELDAAAAQELQGHLTICNGCRAAHNTLVKEEREVRLGFEALARNVERTLHDQLEANQPDSPDSSQGGPDSSAIGAAKPQEVIRSAWPSSCAYGTPIAELSGPPTVREPSRFSSDENGTVPLDNHVHVSKHQPFERINKMILAHKRLSIATAAAVALMAASVIVYVSLLSSAPAYALEETIAANSHVTNYHAKFMPASEISEIWVQLNPDGTLLRTRLDLFSPEDGPKTSIVSKDKAAVWFKIKHSYVVMNDKDQIQRVFDETTKMRALFDPRFAFEQLQEAQKAGKMHVETREPMKEGQPITLTVTSKETPDRMEVYEVDPDTKLVQQVITWHRPDATKENQWKITQVREYLDYNKEFDPKVFQLELPKGTVTIDRIRTIVGLEKGKLTDDEIATKVAREFFDALIAEDYERAGPLLEGMPAEQLKNSFGRMKFSRIIEIGQPVAGQHPDKSVLRVPVKVEWGLRDDKIIKQLSQKVRTTDEEKAVKVVREFYDAFNHEDVDVARRITEEAGLGDGVFDVEHFKKEREQIKSLRIVEIGKPSVDSAAGSTEVPVKVEFEVGRSVQEFKPFVRPETDGRWTICGGI